MKGLDCIIALKALGEHTRLRILRLLFKERLSVTGISERLVCSQYYILLAAIWGSPRVINGKLYVGDEDGDVVVLRRAWKRPRYRPTVRCSS
jgi:DNA-binding transcriptional ArsR family regulator